MYEKITKIFTFELAIIFEYSCNFSLNSNLRWPFRRVVATVIHDFRPLEVSQLALRPGAKLLVLSKEGDSRGWWKGRTLDKVTSPTNIPQRIEL